MESILELFFPKRCVGCKKFGIYFCKDCIGNIKQGELICPICEGLAVGGQTHPLCLKRFGLDGLWSLGVYSNPLKEAIVQLKYKYVKELSQTLVDIFIYYWAIYQPFLLDKIKLSNGKDWVVIPVPLHPVRQNWRGFNQAQVIGQDLSKRLGLSYCESLKRVRLTKPQAKLKGLDRRQNIKNAFEIDSSLRGAKRAPRRGTDNLTNVLLIDDVWTTGSTMRECCEVLKKAGAKRVWAITLAR